MTVRTGAEGGLEARGFSIVIRARAVIAADFNAVAWCGSSGPVIEVAAVLTATAQFCEVIAHSSSSLASSQLDARTFSAVAPSGLSTM